MKHLSLRWRLTLYYAAVWALILVAGSLAFLIGLRSNLTRALDDNLHEAALLAATQLGGDEAAEEVGSTENSNLGRKLPGATTMLVFDEQRRITDRLGNLKLPAPSGKGVKSEAGVRVFTLQLPNGEWIQAARSEVEALEVFAWMRQLILFGVPILLLLGLGAGYFMADRALRPIDSVSTLAANIANGGRYQDRVPPVSSDDELSRLIDTVNAMLATLEATIERERTFALAAAHELRSPLTVLRGRASVTLERDLSPQQYRKAVEQMLEVSVELSAMVESLLALAQTNRPLPQQPINLAAAAFEAVCNQRLGADARGMSLHLDLSAAPSLGDPVSLRVVAANLISNAVRYGRNGGNVWVRTQYLQNRAILQVDDDGEGIPADELERLQQPFQRGHHVQGHAGAGVGLALVKAIIEQHRGRLELGGAEAGGLSAKVVLPG